MSETTTTHPGGIETRWFPSKVDWWLGVLLVILPLSQLAVVGSGLARGDSSEIVVGVISTLAVGALYGCLIFPMRYGIGPEELVIRHGLCRQRVRLRDIQEVRPTGNPLSSPALSLDRVEIRVGPGCFSPSYISPADRDGFLELLAANAGLVREGKRLVRPLP